MSGDIDAKWLAEKIGERTIRGIALETSALIRAGVLPVGMRLPPLRDLAFEMGISPATLSEAWSELRKQKVITGKGRQGTRVSENRFISKPERFADNGNYRADVIDLRMAVPDVRLLPELDGAFAFATQLKDLNTYERSRITDELRGAVSKRWPYEAKALLATNGGYNAFYTVIRAVVPHNSVVAIENPTAMRLLDILEDYGVRIIPVSCDEQGPRPDSLRQAMTHKPAAFIFQPRLHAVTGLTMTSDRLAQIGDVLEGSNTLIIEDDGVADLSAAPPQSLGSRFPEQTIHIVSYSKTLGPDLRLAVLSSTDEIIEQIQSYRSFSSGWTSRLLQGATAWLLNHPETQANIIRARSIYQARRDGLADALRKRGIVLRPGNGLCHWIPVASEQFAIVTLAARNIAVNPGSKYSLEPVNHIRVSTSTLDPSLHEDVAEAISLASA
ncbi:PLP-dependent aminotransferase family protein [Limoniibacter endophyticus]|uniref:GntR family transcriptional regulator n=1 Tax=Limoniibacter endophyticus TaxID=1565040 RepID=A0A8J3DI38_9HYPH|nr:PLP-dependent aminotransferase family protein [Limoniibacter endophyticus]GHC70123.1 GntR family transcriptional regulator [Limoniibacter endophyticus]